MSARAVAALPWLPCALATVVMILASLNVLVAGQSSFTLRQLSSDLPREGDLLEFEVAFSGPPPVDVEIRIAGTNTTQVADAELFINSTNWNTTSHRFLAGPSANNFIQVSPYSIPLVLQVTTPSFVSDMVVDMVALDNNTADVLRELDSSRPYPQGAVPEGTYVEYLLTLASIPTHPVVVDLVVDAGLVSLTPQRVAFEPTTWNVPQVVRVAVPDNDVYAAAAVSTDTVEFHVSSNDTNFDASDQQNLNITVADDEAGPSISFASLRWEAVPYPHGFVVRFDVDIAAAGHDARTPRTLHFGDGNSAQLPSDPIYLTDAFNQTIVRYTMYHTYARGVDRSQRAWVEVCCVAKFVSTTIDAPLTLQADVQLNLLQNTSSPFVPAVTAWQYHARPLAINATTHVADDTYVPVTHVRGWASPYAAPLRYAIANSAVGGTVHGVPAWITIDPYMGVVIVDPAAAYPGQFLVPVRVSNVLTDASSTYTFVLDVPASATTIATDSAAATAAAALATTSPLDAAAWLSRMDQGYTDDVDAAVADLVSAIGTGAHEDFARGDSPLRCVTDVQDFVSACVVQTAFGGSATVEAMATALGNATTYTLHTPGAVAPLLASTAGADGTYLPALPSIADSAQASATPPGAPALYALAWVVGVQDGANETLALIPEDTHVAVGSGQDVLADVAALGSDGIDVQHLTHTSLLVTLDAHAIGTGAGDLRAAAESLVGTLTLRLQYTHAGLKPRAGTRNIMVAVGDSTGLVTVHAGSVEPAPTPVAPVLDLDPTDPASSDFATVYYDQQHSTNISLTAQPDGMVLQQPRAPIARATVAIHPAMDAPYEMLSAPYEAPTASWPPAVFSSSESLHFAQQGLSTITVPHSSAAAARPVTDVVIAVHVLHGQVGDLTLALHRHGRPYVLAEYVGGPSCDAANLLATTFTTDSDIPLSGRADGAGACVPGAQGVFRPAQSLAALLGEYADGEWTLSITDAGVGAGSDTTRGLLLSWSIAFYTDLSSPATAGATSSSNSHGAVGALPTGAAVPFASPVYRSSTPVPRLGALAAPRTLPWHEAYSNSNSSSDSITARDTITIDDVQGRVRSVVVEAHLAYPPTFVGSNATVTLSLQHGDDNVTLMQYNRQEAIAALLAGNAAAPSERCVPEGFFAFADDASLYGDAAASSFAMADLCAAVAGVDAPPLRLGAPAEALAAFAGSRVTGEWTLVLEADGSPVAVGGWAVRFSLEPNVDTAFNATTGVLELWGVDSPDNYRAVLDSIVYSNDAPTTEPEPLRNITFTVVDDLGTEATASALVAIHHLLSIELLPIDEDDTTSQGKLNRVSTMLALTTPPNADANDNWPERAGYGVVITMVDNSNGDWQYSLDGGHTFLSIGNVSRTDGLLLPGSDVGDGVVDVGLAEPWNTTILAAGSDHAYEGLVRFVPSKDFHGTARIGFSMWNTDALALPAGTRTDTSKHPVSLHNASAIATLEVLPVNDQPILTANGVLETIVEDDVDNTGTLVADVVAGIFFDMDTLSPVADTFSDEMGLAITGVDRRNGDWLWSCANEEAYYDALLANTANGTANSTVSTTAAFLNGTALSATFVPFIGGILPNNDTWPPNPTPAMATVLGPGCRIKFSPSEDFNTQLTTAGEPWSDASAIRPWIRALPWDMTDDIASGTFSVDTRAGRTDVTSPFGSTPRFLYINVTEVNDAPQLRMGGPGDNYSTVYVEGHGPISIAGPAFVVADPDNAALASATLQLSGVADTLEYEHIVFNTTQLDIAGEGNYTLTYDATAVVNGSELHAAPTSASIPVLLHLDDAVSGARLTVEAAPLNTTAHDSSSNGTAASNTTVPSTMTTGMVVRVWCASDVATGTKCPLSLFRDVLLAAQYVDTLAEPTNGTRTIEVSVSDGLATTRAMTTVIVVHTLENAPVLGLDAALGTTTFTEQGGAVSPLAALTLFDEDHNEFYGIAAAEVGLTSWQAGHDTLAVSSNATQHTHVAVAFNATTGVLTLTGTASVAAYQALLQAVQFANDEDEPRGFERSIAVQVTDTAGLVSNVVVARLPIQLVNDHAPVIVMSEPVYTVVEGTDHVLALGGDISLSDADVPASTADRYPPISQHFLASATLTLTPLGQGSAYAASFASAFPDGRLVVNASRAAAFATPYANDNTSNDTEVSVITTTHSAGAYNDTVVVNAGGVAGANLSVRAYADGSLSLVGPAPIEVFAGVLASLQYETWVEEFDSAELNVSLSVSDGLFVSTASTLLVLEPVNDVPVFSGDAAVTPAPVFVEGSATPMRVFNNAFRVTDNDNATLPLATITLAPIDTTLAPTSSSSGSSSDADVEVLVVPADVWAAIANVSMQGNYSNTNGSTTLTSSNSTTNGTSTSLNSTSTTNNTTNTGLPVLRGNGTAVLEVANIGPAALTQLLHSIGYKHLDANPGNPTPGIRTITLVVTDGQATTSIGINASLEVVAVDPVNDAPFFITVGSVRDVVFVEEAVQPVPVFTANRSVMDVDSADMHRFTAALTDAEQESEFVVLGDVATTWQRYLLESCARLCPSTDAAAWYASTGQNVLSTPTAAASTTSASGSGVLPFSTDTTTATTSTSSSTASTATFDVNGTSTATSTQSTTSAATTSSSGSGSGLLGFSTTSMSSTTSSTFGGDASAACQQLCVAVNATWFDFPIPSEASSTVANRKDNDCGVVHGDVVTFSFVDWMVGDRDADALLANATQYATDTLAAVLPEMQPAHLHIPCDTLCADAAVADSSLCYYRCSLYRELGKQVDVLANTTTEQTVDALSTIAYWNVEDEMQGSSRQVDMQVADDNSMWSSVLTVPVTLVPVNDAPRLYVDGNRNSTTNITRAITYTERELGTPLFASGAGVVLLEDDDDQLISEIAVELTNAPANSREGLFLNVDALAPAFVVEFQLSAGPTGPTTSTSSSTTSSSTTSTSSSSTFNGTHSTSTSSSTTMNGTLSTTSSSSSTFNGTHSTSTSSSTTDAPTTATTSTPMTMSSATIVIRDNRTGAVAIVVESWSPVTVYPALTDYERVQAERGELHPVITAAIPLGHALHMTVNNATLATAQTILQAISYTNVEQLLVQPQVERIVRVHVRDSYAAASSNVTVRASLISVNNAPLLNATRLVATQEEAEDGPGVTFDVLPAYVDAESKPWFAPEQRMPGYVEVMQLPVHGNLTLEADSTVLRYVPAAEDYGVRPFVVRACDPLGLCSENVTLTVVVQSINDAPAQRSDVLRYDVVEDTVTDIPLDLFYIDVEEYHLEPFHADIDGAGAMQVTLLPDAVQQAVKPIDEQGILSLYLNTTTRVLRLTPVKNYAGPANVAFTVCDTEGLCTNMTLHVNVTAVNDVPAVAALLQTRVREDTLTVLPFTSYDVEDSACPRDPINTRYCQLLQVRITAQPSHGMARLLLSNDTSLPLELRYSIEYNPDEHYFGVDSLTISSCDSDGGCSTSVVTITVTAVDDPIMLTIEHVNVNEDEVLTLNLLGYVQDVDNVVTAGGINMTRAPLYGTTTYDDQTGVFVYAPLQHYFGEDSVTFLLCNEAGDCGSATLNITVVSVNDVPVVLNTDVEVWEDNTIVVDLLALTSDVANEMAGVLPDTITITTAPAYGSVAYNASATRVQESRASTGATGAAAATALAVEGPYGTATYTPNQDYFGEDRFGFTACDGSGACRSGFVFITVLAVNDRPRVATGQPDPRTGAPTATAILPFTAEEDTLNLLAVYALHDDVDFSEDHVRPSPDDLAAFASGERPDLFLTVYDPPLHGEVTMYSFFGLAGYRPNTDYVGPDAFSYRVCDPCSTTRNAEFGRIAPSTDPACVRQRVEYGASAVAGGDDDLELGCTIVNVTVQVRNVNDRPNAANLATVVEPTGTAVFAPLDSTRDIDDVQFAHVHALVEATAGNATLQVLEDDYNLVTDDDIDVASVQVVAQPSSGARAEVVYTHDAVTNTSVPTIVYTPPNHPSLAAANNSDTLFFGADDFTYSVCDVQGECDLATITVHVASPTPQITSVRALGACVNGADLIAGMSPSALRLRESLTCDPDGVFTDAGYGDGDRFLVQFDSATNMPPYGRAGVGLLEEDVLQLFSFSQALKPTAGSGSDADVSITGEWVDPTLFVITASGSMGAYAPVFSATALNISVPGTRDRLCGQYGHTSAAPGIITVEVDDMEGKEDAELTPAPITSDDGSIALKTNVERDPYCILSADELSFHAASTVVGVSGDFGLTLPGVIGVEVTNPPQVEPDYLGRGTVLSVVMQPALPLGLLYKLCSRGTADVFDLSVLASSAEATLDCSVVLGSDDSEVSASMTEREYACQFEPHTLTRAELAQCTNTNTNNDNNRRRRTANSGFAVGGDDDGADRDSGLLLSARKRRDATATTTGTATTTTTSTAAATTSVTATSNRLRLYFTSLSGLKLKPSDAGFTEAVARMLNTDTLRAAVLGDTFGVSASALDTYTTSREDALVALFEQLALGLRYVGNNVETPMLTSVHAYRPTAAFLKATGAEMLGELQPGCTLVLEFDRDTNTPSTSPASSVDLYPYLSDKAAAAARAQDLENTVLALSQRDVDRLLTFEPSLGSFSSDTNRTEDAYVGRWTSLSTLEIVIFSPNTVSRALIASPQALTISFTPTSSGNPCVEDPSPCTTDADNGNWGICNTMGTSCRAYEAFAGQNITGSWATDVTLGGSTSTAVESSSYLYLLLLAVPAMAVGAVIVYRRSRRQRDKKRMGRLVNRWRSMLGTDLVDNPVLKTTSTDWSRPPGMTAMRAHSDPFLTEGEGGDPFAGGQQKQQDAQGVPMAGTGLYDSAFGDSVPRTEPFAAQQRIDAILRSPTQPMGGAGAQQAQQQQQDVLNTSTVATLGKGSRIVLPPLRKGVQRVPSLRTLDARGQQQQQQQQPNGAGAGASVRDLPPLKRATLRGSQRLPGIPVGPPMELPHMTPSQPQQAQQQQKGNARLPPLRAGPASFARKPTLPSFPQGPAPGQRVIRPVRPPGMGNDSAMGGGVSGPNAFKPRSNAALPSMDRRFTDPFATAGPAAAAAAGTNINGSDVTTTGAGGVKGGGGDGQRSTSGSSDPFRRRPSVQRPQVPGSIRRASQGSGVAAQPPMRVPSLKSGAPPPMRMPEMSGPRRVSLQAPNPLRKMSRPSADMSRPAAVPGMRVGPGAGADLPKLARPGGMPRPTRPVGGALPSMTTPGAAMMKPRKNSSDSGEDSGVSGAVTGDTERKSNKAKVQDAMKDASSTEDMSSTTDDGATSTSGDMDNGYVVVEGAEGVETDDGARTPEGRLVVELSDVEGNGGGGGGTSDRESKA
ncbi:hypothetical protein PTSG_09794 [Salpingoeca rosetta]|uniref:P/Homo B domain-containing protein n=1 Tax=Salpingoeca rosetta (strain ATCC 50818 / BSB-021) TaxID=946362 RepID=F2UP29_SALR5|nr:uncharacterized protein PTSG_09794 [Salpingoeca rosetta]EGD79384.1 hypothetical protein PTSG_09794 [Salpingoeca rosetta]|eukprot:XP_004989153.1 hypothetical protein PTSG_09794 [Salpingoeca rosetta]